MKWIALLLVVLGLVAQAIPRARIHPETVEGLDEKPGILDVAHPGFVASQEGFIASLLWIQVGASYADWVLDSRQSLLLRKRIMTVANLDPAWKEPYRIGAMMLSDDAVADAVGARELLRSGIGRFPEDWQMRVYLAMSLMNDTAGSSEIPGILAPLVYAKDSVPDYVRSLAASQVAGVYGQDAHERWPMLMRLAGRDSPYATRRSIAQKLVHHLRRTNRLNERTARECADSLVQCLLQGGGREAISLGLLQRLLPATAPAPESSKNR